MTNRMRQTETDRKEPENAEHTNQPETVYSLGGDPMWIEPNIYDKEEIYPNCTVQVLTNTLTGETSVGWWINPD